MNQDIRRIGASARFSQIVIHDRTVYLAGQVSQLTDGDVAAQAFDIFSKIESLLAEAGSDKNRMLSAQIWLADMVVE